MTFVAPLLAHQGGWDEALLVGVPIVVIIGALALAKRRVESASSHGVGPDDPRDARS